MGPAFTLRRYDSAENQCLDKLLFDNIENLIMGLGIHWFFVVYAIPIAIFIALYSKTLLTLRQKREANQESHILKLADQQMTRTAIAVAVVFIISLSWDAIGSVIGYAGYFCYMPHTPASDIGVFMAALNSCANPFIYALFLPAFRRSLKGTFRIGESTHAGDQTKSESNIMEPTKLPLTSMKT